MTDTQAPGEAPVSAQVPAPNTPSVKTTVGGVAALGLTWALLDQLSKYFVVATLTRLIPEGASLGQKISLYFGTDQLYGLALPPAKVLGSFWHHVYVQNPAGAFGLLGGAPLGVRRAVFIVVACLATAGLLWMAARSVRIPLAYPRLHRLALALVFGGALGNLSDRIAHGYVIDFIDWHLGASHWPAFNVADVGIVVGVFTLILFGKPRSSPQPAVRPSPAARPSDDSANETPLAQGQLATEAAGKPE